MAIYDEVLTWAEKLPPWRQDALRRLCETGSWSANDLDEILILVKKQHSVSKDSEDAEAAPFTADHFPSEAMQGSKVVITSLHSLKNVGRIPSDQKLEFSSDKLTIVYGGNGTGKSAYARLLKQACRARSPGTVYADAYNPNFQQLVPSAILEFEADGIPGQENWNAGRGHVSKAELRGISVFDGDCARHYLQSREVAAYQPAALAHLQQLAHGLNQALRPRIQADISALATDSALFNVITADTEAGRAVHPLSAQTDLSRARVLGVLSADELQELERLPQEIAETDPASKATILENAAARVEELARAVEAANVVSDELIDFRQSTYQKLQDAEAAEKAASSSLQSDDAAQLLPGTGQGPWALLFNAARDYSSKAAYPDDEFPVTSDSAQCVLCQQELTQNAKERLHRFDRFVRDSASAAAQTARKSWQNTVNEVGLANATFTLSEAMATSLASRIPTLPAEIRTFQEDLALRMRWLREAVVAGQWENRPSPQAKNPAAAIRQVGEVVRAEAASLLANLDTKALAAKRLRLKELEARRLLSEHLASIGQVVEKLALKAKLQSCLEDISNTRSISLFAGQLAKKHVTETLASQMNEELRSLDLYHIHAEISSAGDAGSTRLGIALSNSQLAPHLVLSEAEQRMCALSYFFSELQHSGSTSGVVFDDPVSSLDHNHRTAVARRIVEESKNRQVIVFTHDAVFFGELVTLGGDAGIEPTVRSINYRAEGPGYIDSGLPYDLRKHRERIIQHRLDHQQISNAFNNPPGDVERISIRNAYDDLRVTIEVGIEETILNGTVVRFRDNISVGRLNGVMVVEDSEFREVQRLHDKCCRNVRAHSHAAGQQRSVTQPLELSQDIEAVNQLFSAIRKRIG